MNLQRELRNRLYLYFRRDVHDEPACSCGAANHARIFLFRVNGEPAMVVAPETSALNASQLSLILDNARVEPLSAPELDSIFLDSELGHMDPFENPFGTGIYLDESLSQFDELVFCPKMSSQQRGECFSVPTREFRQMTHPILLRLSPLVTESHS